MEYPNLVETKKRLIIKHLRYMNLWDDSLPYVLYSFSFLPLRDMLGGIDTAYEEAYEKVHHKLPKKTYDLDAMTTLVKTFIGSNLNVSTIANVLNYDEAIVRYILTNTATLTQQQYDYEADLKIARDTDNKDRGALEEGEELEIEKCRAEGRAEGEAKERVNSFRTMLAFGIPADQIAEKYGMTTEEVLRIATLN